MKYLFFTFCLISAANLTHSSNFRIVGGKKAPKTPHQIAFFDQGAFNCGGALIGNQTAITAGHCVYFHPKEPQRFLIHYGSSEYHKGTEAKIAKIIIHPQFRYYNSPEYDVAILHLSEPFKHSENASIIPLASVSPSPGTFVNITGWGRFNENTEFPEKLQIAENLVVLNQTVCQKKLEHLNITNHILCAHSETQGICGGDSGSPLVSDGKLVGVASFAAKVCTQLAIPNGFSDVASMRDFIDKHII